MKVTLVHHLGGRDRRVRRGGEPEHTVAWLARRLAMTRLAMMERAR
jgi:hypothetical protein